MKIYHAKLLGIVAIASCLGGCFESCGPTGPNGPSGGGNGTAPGSLRLTVRYNVVCATSTDPNAACSGGFDIPRACWSGTAQSPRGSGSASFRDACSQASHDSSIRNQYTAAAAAGNLAPGSWTVGFRDDKGAGANCQANVPAGSNGSATVLVDVNNGAVSCAAF